MFIKFEQTCVKPGNERKFKTLQEAFDAAEHGKRYGTCRCKITEEMRPSWGSGHYKLVDDGTLECVSYDYDSSG